MHVRDNLFHRPNLPHCVVKTKQQVEQVMKLGFPKMAKKISLTSILMLMKDVPLTQKSKLSYEQIGYVLYLEICRKL